MNWVSALRYVALFAVYVCTSCVGLYFIKSAPGWRSLTFVGGFALYALGALLWMVILRLLALSFAFPIAAGALVLGTMLTGVILLGESITTLQVIGALLIMSGIVLIAVNQST
jgi:multidrug transporter EmrE-like cation transporter